MSVPDMLPVFSSVFDQELLASTSQFIAVVESVLDEGSACLGSRDLPASSSRIAENTLWLSLMLCRTRKGVN